MKTRIAIWCALVSVPSGACAHAGMSAKTLGPISRTQLINTMLTNAPARHARSAGSTCETYNPALYKPGNTYRIINKLSETGGHDHTQTVDSKVLGPATFQGHPAVDIRVRAVESRYPSGKVSATTDVFYGTRGKFLYFYGERSQTGAEAYSDPPFSYPKRYVLNTPYTQTITEHEAGAGTHYSFTQQKTTTFLGMKRITVPAGTFMTCKMKTEISSASNTSQRIIEYDWVVASGRYAGLGIKATNLRSTPGSPPAVILTKAAVSIRLDGR